MLLKNLIRGKKTVKKISELSERLINLAIAVYYALDYEEGRDSIEIGNETNAKAAFELKVIAAGERLTAYISSTLRERAQKELRIDSGSVSLTLQRFYDKDGKQQLEVLDFTVA